MQILVYIPHRPTMVLTPEVELSKGCWVWLLWKLWKVLALNRIVRFSSEYNCRALDSSVLVPDRIASFFSSLFVILHCSTR